MTQGVIMFRSLVLSLAILLAAVTGANTQLSVTNVGAVAAVKGSTYPTITGQTWGGTLYPYIYASGYYNPGDGGGGLFSLTGTNCKTSSTISGNAGSSGEITLSTTKTITRGMAVSG